MADWPLVGSQKVLAGLLLNGKGKAWFSLPSRIDEIAIDPGAVPRRIGHCSERSRTGVFMAFCELIKSACFTQRFRGTLIRPHTAEKES